VCCSKADFDKKSGLKFSNSSYITHSIFWKFDLKINVSGITKCKPMDLSGDLLLSSKTTFELSTVTEIYDEKYFLKN
jgi:hypothetical protein